MKNTMSRPLVSVIMPVYNAGGYLVPAIESILNQTYENIELIIVDDASIDGSGQVLSKYAKKYPKRIKLITLEKNVNKGGDVAGNIGYVEAKGKYVARMDADDIARVDRIEKQVMYLEEYQYVDVLGSCATVIDSEGKTLGDKIVPSTHEQIYSEFFVYHPIIHPTVMVRKSAIRRKRLYKLDYMANNDYLTFIQLISRGKRFANLPDKLLQYRMHENNDSLTGVKKNFINSLKIRARAVKEYGYKPNAVGVAKLMGQVLVVVLLPEKVIVSLYMIMRGIKKPVDYLRTPRILEGLNYNPRKTVAYVVAHFVSR